MNKGVKKMAKNGSQKGKPTADTTQPVIAKEELKKAIHPTKRQNAQQ
jgi:hypothetical protein